MSVNLDNFLLPQDADISKINRPINLANGVTTYSGHDKGVPYRFFEGEIYNETKSKIAGSDIYEPVEMIEFFVDKFSKPCQIVTDEIKAKYPEEYRRFREGLEAPGTPLHRWGKCSAANLRTLNAARIFSVEQFASYPKAKFSGAFPLEIQELHEHANRFVNSQEGRTNTEKLADKLAEQEQEKAIMQAQIDALQEQVKQLAVKRNKKKDLVSE